MPEADEDPLTKVHVPLPDNPHSGGEALWALPLGNALFELRNVPFYAYGLNFGDVVRAEAPAPDQKPSVLQVIRSGGHRTIWLTFCDQQTSEQRGRLLEELNPYRGYFEGVDGAYFAIDVEPEGDYNAIRARVASWQALGILEFHEGEAGGFRPRHNPSD